MEFSGPVSAFVDRRLHTLRNRLARTAKLAFDASDRTLRPLLVWRDTQDRLIVAWLIGLIIVYVVLDLLHKLPLNRLPEYIEYSGFLVGIYFLVRSQNVKDQFERMFCRLVDRGVVRFVEKHNAGQSLLLAAPGPRESIVLSDPRMPNLRREALDRLERSAATSAAGAGAIMLVLGIAYLYSRLSYFEFTDTNLASDVLTDVFETWAWAAGGAYVLQVISIFVEWPLTAVKSIIVMALALLFGMRLGRMAWYSSRARSIDRAEHGRYILRLLPVPGHVDGNCGLKPVADFLIYQITRVVWPFIYLLIWYLILTSNAPAWKILFSNGASAVANLFLAVMVFIMVVQVFGLLIPSQALRRQVADARRAREPDADALSNAIADLRGRLGKETDSNARAEIQERVDAQTALYNDLEGMRFRPVTIGTLAPLLLVLAEVPALAGANFPQLLNFIERLAGA